MPASNSRRSANQLAETIPIVPIVDDDSLATGLAVTLRHVGGHRKAILAASRGTQAGRFVLPPADVGELVGYGVCPAETLARLIEQISAWQWQKIRETFVGSRASKGLPLRGRRKHSVKQKHAKPLGR